MFEYIKQYQPQISTVILRCTQDIQHDCIHPKIYPIITKTTSSFIPRTNQLPIKILSTIFRVKVFPLCYSRLNSTKCQIFTNGCSFLWWFLLSRCILGHVKLVNAFSDTNVLLPWCVEHLRPHQNACQTTIL